MPARLTTNANTFFKSQTYCAVSSVHKFECEFTDSDDKRATFELLKQCNDVWTEYRATLSACANFCFCLFVCFPSFFKKWWFLLSGIWFSLFFTSSPWRIIVRAAPFPRKHPTPTKESHTHKSKRLRRLLDEENIKNLRFVTSFSFLFPVYSLFCNQNIFLFTFVQTITTTKHPVILTSIGRKMYQQNDVTQNVT